MKKISLKTVGLYGCKAAIACGLLLSVSALPSCGTLGQGSTIGSTSGSSSSDNSQTMLGSLLSGLIGQAVPLTQKTLIGTWYYQSPDVRFESDNALAKAGGALAASTAESKVAELYNMIGIRKGNCYYTFNEDGTCKIKLGSIPLNGTYTFDPNSRELKIKAGLGMVNMTAKVYYDMSQLTLLFDADKLLSMAQNVGNFTGKGSSTLSTISSVLNSYDGLMLGMNLKK